MNGVDIVAIILLLMFVAAGSKRGLVAGLGQLVSALAGFFAARAWYGLVGGFLGMVAPGHPDIARIIAFVLIFSIVERALSLCVRLIDGVLRVITHLPLISSLDSLLGAIIGFVQGMVALGACAYVITMLVRLPALVGLMHTSSVVIWIERVFARLLIFFV